MIDKNLVYLILYLILSLIIIKCLFSNSTETFTGKHHNRNHNKNKNHNHNHNHNHNQEEESDSEDERITDQDYEYIKAEMKRSMDQSLDIYLEKHSNLIEGNMENFKIAFNWYWNKMIKQYIDDNNLHHLSCIEKQVQYNEYSKQLLKEMPNPIILIKLKKIEECGENCKLRKKLNQCTSELNNQNYDLNNNNPSTNRPETNSPFTQEPNTFRPMIMPKKQNHRQQRQNPQQQGQNLHQQGGQRQQQAQNNCNNQQQQAIDMPITCGCNNILEEESNYLLEPSYENINQNNQYANVNNCNGKSSISEESILEVGWTYLPKEIDKALNTQNNNQSCNSRKQNKKNIPMPNLSSSRTDNLLEFKVK